MLNAICMEVRRNCKVKNYESVDENVSRVTTN